MDKLRIPVLPIPNVVFFPNTSIPILVSEPIYIRMIHECIESGSLMAIAMAQPVQEFSYHVKYSPQKVATMGKPLLIEEKYDGSIKVLIRGVSRVCLEKVVQNLPYLVYEVGPLPDKKEKHAILCEDDKIGRLKSILDQWMAQTIPDSIEREAFSKNLEGLSHIVDYLSMFLIQDADMRQLILENRSLFERIQILSSLLRGKCPKKEDSSVLYAMKDFEDLEYEYKIAH
jgi:uncharacterized protein